MKLTILVGLKMCILIHGEKANFLIMFLIDV